MSARNDTEEFERKLPALKQTQIKRELGEMFKRNLFAIAIISLGFIFTTGAFGQTGGRSRQRKLQKPPVKQSITVLDNEARMSLIRTANENRRKSLAGQTPPTVPNGTRRVNKPFLEDENRDGDLDDSGERKANGTIRSRRNPNSGNALVKNESLKELTGKRNPTTKGLTKVGAGTLPLTVRGRRKRN